MRYLSVQLPDFSLVRMRLASRRRGETWPPEAAAAGLIRHQANAPRLVAVTPEAAGHGIRAGMVLADARAILPGLLVRDAEPAADDKAMAALAEWLLRYSPQVALDGDPITPFAAIMEITGCAHLFGGEAAMRADIHKRLGLWGFAVRTGFGSSQAEAWARARCAHEGALEDLPIAALRIDENTFSSLRRLGFSRIGELAELPKRSLLERFPPILPQRLDALLHNRLEAFTPWREVPAFTARLGWPEPIGTTAAIEAATHELSKRIVSELDHARRGARHLRLILGRVDGALHKLDLRLGQPKRDAGHITRLFAMQLDGLDIGFGIEFMALEVTDSMPLEAAQGDLVSRQDQTALDRLTDQLRQRLGEGRVMRLEPRMSHIPERAQVPIEAEYELSPTPWLACQPRPLRLLARAEPITAMARVPDGPPRHLSIEGQCRQVIEAHGPERIEPEWWHLNESMRVRDYWRAMDETGAVHWLYRAGQYGDPRPPQWYRHGAFE